MTERGNEHDQGKSIIDKVGRKEKDGVHKSCISTNCRCFGILPKFSRAGYRNPDSGFTVYDSKLVPGTGYIFH